MLLSDFAIFQLARRIIKQQKLRESLLENGIAVPFLAAPKPSKQKRSPKKSVAKSLPKGQGTKVRERKKECHSVSKVNSTLPSNTVRVSKNKEEEKSSKDIENLQAQVSQMRRSVQFYTKKLLEMKRAAQSQGNFFFKWYLNGFITKCF